LGKQTAVQLSWTRHDIGIENVRGRMSPKNCPMVKCLAVIVCRQTVWWEKLTGS